MTRTTHAVTGRLGPVALLSLLALLALTAAACSSSSKPAAARTTTTASTAAGSSSTTAVSSTSSTATPPDTVANIATLTKIGPAAVSPFTVSLAKGPAGIFLVGPNGHSLYIFTKDQGTTSACKGECLQLWPPLTTSATATSGPGINAAKVSVVHGQVAYYGRLLYYYAGDSAPNQTKGTTIPEWNLLGPFGNVMLPHPA
jgi:predicted lipoprotein with Yx(FWY)xxD motif